MRKTRFQDFKRAWGLLAVAVVVAAAAATASPDAAAAPPPQAGALVQHPLAPLCSARQGSSERALKLEQHMCQLLSGPSFLVKDDVMVQGAVNYAADDGVQGTLILDNSGGNATLLAIQGDGAPHCRAADVVHCTRGQGGWHQ